MVITIIINMINIIIRTLGELSKHTELELKSLGLKDNDLINQNYCSKFKYYIYYNY